MVEFKVRLKQLMEEKGLEQADIVRDVGIPKSSISMYLAGTRTPKQDTILALSRKYNVNLEWLHGYENVPMKKNDVPTFNEDHIEMIQIYDSLPKSEQDKMMQIIRLLSGAAGVTEIVKKERDE